MRNYCVRRQITSSFWLLPFYITAIDISSLQKSAQPAFPLRRYYCCTLSQDHVPHYIVVRKCITVHDIRLLTRNKLRAKIFQSRWIYARNIEHLFPHKLLVSSMRHDAWARFSWIRVALHRRRIADLSAWVNKTAHNTIHTYMYKLPHHAGSHCILMINPQ